MRSNPAISQHLLSQLLALRPYIEHILCEGSRDPHVRAAVEDQVQTVMRKASRYLPLYRPHREGLRPWVTRIAKNVRTDAHRSAQSYDNAFGHDHVAAEEAADPGPSPEADAQTRAFLDKVFEHIKEMPPELRDVLYLAAFCGDSHADIAAILKITEGATKMRLSRARKMLRKRAGSLRDHLPLWLLVFLRKFPAPRGLRLNRLRAFFWRTGQLLPPLIVWFVALPQLDRAAPLPTENVIVALPHDEPAPLVRDERQLVDVVEPNQPAVQGAIGAITPKRHPSMNVSVDKPRRRMQANHDFDVVLPPTNTIVNGRE